MTLNTHTCFSFYLPGAEEVKWGSERGWERNKEQMKGKYKLLLNETLNKILLLVAS